MTKIDKTKPVLVTGATGYVAGWLVKKLLEEGISVHAAVRNPDKKEKIAHLDAISKRTGTPIKYFKTDLLSEGSYAEAMKGCELVFHTASPFVLNVKNPQKQLIDPAKLGTQNVLKQANKTPGVKRVVVTSSCVAIYTDAIDCKKAPNGVLTEEIWNTTASIKYQPYAYSKTVAEKEAWEISKNQKQWDMVTINPSLVLGPPLNPQYTTSESFNILKQIGDGSFKGGVPDIGMGVVDVRDVAEAHFRAGFTPEAHGRYITSAYNSSLFSFAKELLPKFGKNYPIPKKTMPKFIVWLLGPMIDKSITRRFVSNNINIPWTADNSKIKQELDIQFRPLRETMEDSFQVLIDEGILKPAK